MDTNITLDKIYRNLTCSYCGKNIDYNNTLWISNSGFGEIFCSSECFAKDQACVSIDQNNPYYEKYFRDESIHS